MSYSSGCDRFLRVPTIDPELPFGVGSVPWLFLWSYSLKLQGETSYECIQPPSLALAPRQFDLCGLPFVLRLAARFFFVRPEIPSFVAVQTVPCPLRGIRGALSAAGLPEL